MKACESTTPAFPRDARGRAVARECPVCGSGTLQYDGGGFWRCDGLADPEDVGKPLEACTYTHEDGTDLLPVPRAAVATRLVEC